ncbi:MAG TPA: flagellar hook-associated protein FlgK [Verrucomicrobiae bacterium]|jgi:flagellar hook-associated protein 1 FlgK|nr:flagellar hook-associated protein FlgK [Verrucomicrobiae bacterium]
MLGLFNTLQLGARALQANQLGVEVTGQNLANSSNAAYSRQRLVLSTSLTTPTAFGLQGTGVQVTSIEQVRDTMLDGEMRDESSVSGYWSSQQNSLQNAQTQLGEFLNINSTSTSGSSGLSDQINNLFNAFQSVATNPTSIPQRGSLVNQAQTLASGFNNASQQLSTLNGNLNTSVSNNVTAANQLLSQIASLNSQIAKATATGGSANDLNDTREQDLENLAGIVNIQTTTNANGTVDVSIGGTQMISGIKTLDTLKTYDPGNGQLLVGTANGGTPLTLTGGAIQGTIDTRDGALKTLRDGLDTLASSLITQVNGIYSGGYDLNGGTGQPLFTGTDAGTIGVNSALQTDPSLVQAAGVSGATGDNSVALALAQLGQKSLAGLGNQTFSSAFASQVGTFGFALSNANAQVDNSTSVTGMLQNQRDSVSGVSIEEEVANLITYQQAYTASSKIITTVDQMLQTVLSLKT